MARTKSDFLRSAGKAFEIIKAIADEVLAQGGSDDDIARILSDKELARDLAARIVRDMAETLIATVHYDRSIPDGIAAGKYDRVCSDVSESNFPRSGSGTQDVTFSLIKFGQDMYEEYALRELNRRGFRPATLQELLAVGEQHPGRQRAFPINALGSVKWDPKGYQVVPHLDREGYERILTAHYHRIWPARFRFLAVRK